MKGWINLGRILDDKGISNGKFAEMIGVQKQHVTNYFKPGYDPKISTVIKWCKALEISIVDLLDEGLNPDTKIMPRSRSAEDHDHSIGKRLMEA